MGILKRLHRSQKEDKKKEEAEDVKAYSDYQDWILNSHHMMVSRLVPIGKNQFQSMIDMVRLNDEQYEKIKEVIENDKIKKSGLIVPSK